MRRLVRFGAVGAVVVSALLAAAGTASAHVTAHPGSAAQGSSAEIAFHVPGEEDTASTTKVEVTFPADHPLASVSAESMPGWTIQVQKTKLAKPLRTDDGQVTEAVSKITWSGGTIAPGTFQDFLVSLGPLPTNTDKLVFKAVQTYDNGDVVRWIDMSTPGGAEPEHPAPTLKLTSAGPEVRTAATDSAAPAPVAGPPSSVGVMVSVAVGIVLALVALVLASLALRRRST